MAKFAERVTGTPPVHVLMVLLALTACSDGGGAPLSDDNYPAKGQYIEVTPNVAEIVSVGETLKLAASVRDALGKQISNPRVVWEALDPAVATVDWTGNVKGMNEGVAEIRGTFSGVSATAVVAVSRPKLSNGGSVSVTLYPDADTVPSVGGTTKLLAVGRNPGGKLVGSDKLNWSSADGGVATVDGNGVVTGRKSGQTTIVVQNGSAADSTDVWVAPSGVAVRVEASVQVDTIPTIGATRVLSARVLDGSGAEILGAAISWKSLDPSIAKVGSDGAVTGLAKGVARIVASHNALSDTVMVWVAALPSAAGLYVTPKTDTIPQVGGTMKVTATLMDGTGKTINASVTWGTMDAAIATVATDGTVKGVASGLARITARYNTLVDTAKIWVAPAPPTPAYTVRINPQSASAGVGDSVKVQATVYDSKGAELDRDASWLSLDGATAKVSGPGPSTNMYVKGLKTGAARIVAMYGGAVDTAQVTVTSTGGTGGTGGGGPAGQTTLLPNPATITGLGEKVRLTWEIYDAAGQRIHEVYPTWVSLDPQIASIPAGPSRWAEATGISKGTARIVTTYNGIVDTATVNVQDSGVGTGGGGSAWILLSPAVDTIPSVGGTTQLNAAAKDASGATVASNLISWASTDPATASVNGNGLVQGLAKGTARIVATYASVSDTSWVYVAPAPPPPPPPSGSNLTPSKLWAVLGPLVSRNAGAMQEIKTFDSRYQQTELDRYQNFLADLNNPQGAYLSSNHYGGLRSRLMWAIRNGEPYGAGVTDVNQFAYARGRHIVRRYLDWSKANGFRVPAHNNTGLADIEAYYALEGDPDALSHIHIAAQQATYDPFNYLKMQSVNSDARQIAIALQSFNAAHRLGIPFAINPLAGGAGFDPSPGSWYAAGRRQIDWVRQYAVKTDGSIPSPAHSNAEAYLFNAMLATQLLEWSATVEWDPSLVALARQIMDHLIVVSKPGWSTLGYLSTSPAPATDLAGFYVWPALALWQETGDQKYYDFAIKNLQAANTAYILAVKQWNQVFSTLTEGAEAMLAGKSWR